MKNTKIYKTARQIDVDQDAFRLQDGKIVTRAELEILKQMMPEVSWIVVVWDRGLFPNAGTKLDFNDAK